MRISYEYLAQILSKFLDSTEPHLNWENFDDEIQKDESLFFFHIFILRDKGLLLGATRNPTDIGVEFNGNANTYMTWITPIRLSADGHDFAEALSKPSIKEVIVEKFKDEGPSAVIGIAKSLLEKHAEKLLSGITL